MDEEKMVPALSQEATDKDGVNRKVIVVRDGETWFVTMETDWNKGSTPTLTRVGLTTDGINMLTTLLIEAQHRLSPSFQSA